MKNRPSYLLNVKNFFAIKTNIEKLLKRSRRSVVDSLVGRPAEME
jgi:hypothetical protein